MLHVVSPPGDIIKPSDWKCIQDEGMPVHGRPFEKGNLYVHFKVCGLTGPDQNLARKKGKKQISFFLKKHRSYPPNSDL